MCKRKGKRDTGNKEDCTNREKKSRWRGVFKSRNRARKKRKERTGVASWYDVYDICTAMEEFENISLL